MQLPANIDEKKIGIMTIAVMIIAMAGIAIRGIDKDIGLALLVVFSFTIGFAILFFEEWLEEED